MAQHDYAIADQSGLSFLSDLNNLLAAIASQNSGPVEPSPSYAYQPWVDTSTSPATLRQRNSANSAWLVIGRLDTANLGLIPVGAPASQLSFTQAGAGAVARTVDAKLKESVSDADYGAASKTIIRSRSTNLAVGPDAITGEDNDGVNVAVGINAGRYLKRTTGQALQRGVGNVIVGVDALSSASASCDYNVSVGYRSMESATSAYCNVAVGLRTLAANTTGKYNTAIGCDALLTATSADDNVAIGAKALLVTTSGASNVAVGSASLYNNTTGFENVAVGGLASQTSAAAARNVAVGFRALDLNAAGSDNVALGWWALRANLASGCTAVGNGAAISNTTGTNIVAIGANSARGNTTAANNVAIGTSSLYSNLVGSDNVALGTQALYSTTANQNTGVGTFAGREITSGARNTCIGSSAGFGFSTGTDNTVVGTSAHSTTSSASSCTVVGSSAFSSSTASNNTGVGYLAGYSNTTGSQNVYIGRSAGYANTTGSSNTALGDSALSAGAAFTNCTGVGANSAVTGSNQVQLGDSSTTTYAYGTVQNRSDARDKAEVRDTVLGLEFVNALRPVDFKWNYREDYEGNPDGSRKRNRFHHGLIAQEVKAACNTAGVDFGGYQDHSINGGQDVLTIGYEELIAPLIKAVQQLSAKVKQLEQQLP